MIPNSDINGLVTFQDTWRDLSRAKLSRYSTGDKEDLLINNKSPYPFGLLYYDKNIPNQLVFQYLSPTLSWLF